jgi:hypothetical protein
MMEEGLVARLGASPAIAGGRVYPRVPQKAVFPLVRFNRIGSTRTHAVDGLNVGPTEFVVQIDCMAKSYTESKQLAEDVFNRLNTYKGAWGLDVCRYCMIQTDNDFFEQDGDDVTHWVSQRYVIWTNEA